jgi:hypothetical protein
VERTGVMKELREVMWVEGEVAERWGRKAVD